MNQFNLGSNTGPSNYGSSVGGHYSMQHLSNGQNLWNSTNGQHLSNNTNVRAAENGPVSATERNSMANAAENGKPSEVVGNFRALLARMSGQTPTAEAQTQDLKRPEQVEDNKEEHISPLRKPKTSAPPPSTRFSDIQLCLSLSMYFPYDDFFCQVLCWGLLGFRLKKVLQTLKN